LTGDIYIYKYKKKKKKKKNLSPMGQTPKSTIFGISEPENPGNA
jgi:hypothetical protein